jgi:hypothetical protein
VPECEHGDPRPARCALCRRREDMRFHPWKYPPPATERAPAPASLFEVDRPPPDTP